MTDRKAMRDGNDSIALNANADEPTIPTAFERRPVDALIPFARNPRVHSPRQVAKIAASIREFGFTNPVLITSSGDILAGHGRVLAAQLLGLEQVPVLVLDHLTPTQRRAYVIADNAMALDADWDGEALSLLIEELRHEEFDLELIGLESEATEKFLAKTAESEMAVAPDQLDELGERFDVIVSCRSEQEQASLLERLGAEGYECRALIS